MKISPPAFPTYLAENMALGMTLRDYFAAAAMQSFIATRKHPGIDTVETTKRAYLVADSMLAERNK
jgi:hypothetical protein